MPPKTALVRRIDARSSSTAPVALDLTSVPPAPPASSPIGPINNLALTPALLRSAVTPTAQINATWDPPHAFGYGGQYQIRWSESSSFPDGSTGYADAVNESARIDHLKVSTTYYVQVVRVERQVPGDWAEATTVSTATPVDTTPPAAPTSPAASFIGAGDLVVTWTNATSTNYRDAEIGIYSDSSKTIQYALIYDATGRYVWTAAQNRAATSGSPDPSVYVELRSRSWSSVFSTTVNASATKAPPAAPSPAVDFTGTSLNLSWTAVADASNYRLVLDGTSRDLGTVTRFSYSLAQNASEHAGSPDPSIDWSLVAIDALGQASTAATGTAVNSAPAAPSSVGVTGFDQAIAVAITATKPADFASYTVRLTAGGSTVQTLVGVTSDNPILTKTNGAGTYQVGVRMVDAFGQASNETLSSSVVLDGLTIADLREAAFYVDSVGNSRTALAVLKDSTLASGGQSYASVVGGWRWTEQRRELVDRVRTVTLAIAPAVGQASWYLALSADGGSTYTYYAGPASVSSTGVVTLTKINSTPSALGSADETTAQANALSTNSYGTTTTYTRIDLPAQAECRYVRLGHRNTSGSYTINEFYARRLVQSDDIEAESIKARNIQTGSLTADLMNVAQLSVITQNAGTITAGTLTGTTVQTAASGARIVMNGSTLSTYDGSNVLQIQFNGSANGAMLAGGGAIRIDARGIYARTDVASDVRYGGYQLVHSDGRTYGLLNGLGGTGPQVQLGVYDEIYGGFRNNILFSRNNGTGAESVTITNNGTVSLTGGASLSVTNTISGATISASSVLRAPLCNESSSVYALDSGGSTNAIIIPNAGVGIPFSNASVFAGLIIVQADSGVIAMFLTGGGVISKLADSHNVFSTTYGTAGKINVYLTTSAPTNVVGIDNRLGVTITVRVMALRIRNFN